MQKLTFLKDDLTWFFLVIYFDFDLN